MALPFLSRAKHLWYVSYSTIFVTWISNWNKKLRKKILKNHRYPYLVHLSLLLSLLSRSFLPFLLATLWERYGIAHFYFISYNQSDRVATALSQPLSMSLITEGLPISFPKPKVQLFLGDKELKEDDKPLELFKMRDNQVITLRYEPIQEVGNFSY